MKQPSCSTSRLGYCVQKPVILIYFKPKKNSMNRKEFLSKLGMGAAFALTATCLGGCTKDNSLTAFDLQNVDFTLDLSDPANSALLENGGYVIRNRVVVARNMSGELVAATQVCSHESKVKVIYRNNEWYCTEHGARFALDGQGLNKNGSRGLTVYKTELNGNLLRVFA